MYTYQLDLGDGYHTVYPSGEGLHVDGCDGVDAGEPCRGCWAPETGDPLVWLRQVEDDGLAGRARVLIGGQVLLERVFDEDGGAWSDPDAPVFLAGVAYHAAQQASGRSPDSCREVARVFNTTRWP